MTVIEGLTDDRRLRYRYTVDQYHRMIADGTIEEGAPFELLDGQLVRKLRNTAGDDPMTVGHLHALIVKRLAKLSRKLEPLGCHMQTQQPISIPPHDEPEPDGAVIIGSEEDYTQRHPGASDVLCVIEVADASLQRDRGYKQSIYADTGIPMYVIINLPDDVVEVSTRPLKGKKRYGQVTTLSRDQNLTLFTPSGKGLIVPVKRLLP